MKVRKNMNNFKYITKKIIDKFIKIEPHVTSDLKELSFKTNGTISGLEFKLKSFDSLYRKIELDAI